MALDAGGCTGARAPAAAPPTADDYYSSLAARAARRRRAARPAGRAPTTRRCSPRSTGRTGPAPRSLLAQRADGLLHPRRAGRSSTSPPARPRSSCAQIEAWLQRGRDLPQAAAARRAWRRPAARAPRRPACRAAASTATGGNPKRTRPRTVDDGTMPADGARADPRPHRRRRPRRRASPARRRSTPCSAPRRAPNGASAWRGPTTSRTSTRRRSALGGDAVGARQRSVGRRRASWTTGPRRLAPRRLRRRPARRSSARLTARANPELRAAAHYWASRAATRAAASPSEER